MDSNPNIGNGLPQTDAAYRHPQDNNNADGMTQAEFEELLGEKVSEEEFNRIDLNGDGKISLEELLASIQMKSSSGGGECSGGGSGANSQNSPAGVCGAGGAGAGGSGNSKSDGLAGQLAAAGEKGVEVDTAGMNLQTDKNGQLTEASKDKVNNLVADMTNELGGKEVIAQVYRKDDGSLGLHMTAGDRDSVSFQPPSDTIYSVHSHPNGNTSPSSTDMQNELKGAVDAVISPHDPNNQTEYA